MKLETQEESSARLSLGWKIAYVVASLTVLAVAFFLRLENASERAMHTDEAVQGFQTWRLQIGDGYRYDPVDRHGPTLYFSSVLLNKVLGVSASELTDRRIRYFPILASLLLIGGFLLLPHGGSPTIKLLAAGLFATTPFAVIYGAYYIQESLFVLMSYVLLAESLRYWERPSQAQAAFVGGVVAFLFATKETAVLALPTITASLVCTLRGQILRTWREALRMRNIATALVVFAVLSVLLASQFFTNWAGFRDSVATFSHMLDRAGGEGHEKPFLYYLSIFWPHTAEGARWGQLPLLLLSTLGFALVVARVRPYREQLFISASIWYGVLSLLVYSLIPYKTPWLALGTSFGACIAVGVALHWLWRILPHWTLRLAAPLPLLAWLAYSEYHVTQLNRRYTSDARNPYLYQHTNSPFIRLVERLRELEELEPGKPLQIAIASSEYAWPLPWYLRGQEAVGYWPDAANLPMLDVVIADARLDLSAYPALSDDYIVEYHGVRDNVLLQCYIRKTLWDRLMEQRAS